MSSLGGGQKTKKGLVSFWGWSHFPLGMWFKKERCYNLRPADKTNRCIELVCACTATCPVHRRRGTSPPQLPSWHLTWTMPLWTTRQPVLQLFRPVRLLLLRPEAFLTARLYSQAVSCMTHQVCLQTQTAVVTGWSTKHLELVAIRLIDGFRAELVSPPLVTHHEVTCSM